MINLINGDCIKELSELDENSVDMILVDPPYGTTMCKWDTVLDLTKMWEQVTRVAKDRAAIVFMAAQPFTSILVCSNLKLFKYDLVWEKGNATGFLNAKKMPLRAHESILVFYKKLPAFVPQMTHGHELKTAKRKSVNSECYGKALNLAEYRSTSRYPRSVQFFSSDKQLGNYHPTQKPVNLMEWLINSYTKKGDTVLDFCMGSGTTGVAAKKLNRNFIGIELEKNYFEAAKERINKAESCKEVA
ncbi:site-specific DNA-methyltransferase [uncultured Pseudoalteromonas sp.]|uniref:DNA-methyltransferase n=1 Tax=uncultured Pseudoalteromonas sp. TaxID=114053 RepID=UPI002591ED1E|nr:site-specific DNA-methyltransferase [uncultured Pseudoalteromonas sp.]